MCLALTTPQCRITQEVSGTDHLTMNKLRLLRRCVCYWPPNSEDIRIIQEVCLALTTQQWRKLDYSRRVSGTDHLAVKKLDYSGNVSSIFHPTVKKLGLLRKCVRRWPPDNEEIRITQEVCLAMTTQQWRNWDYSGNVSGSDHPTVRITQKMCLVWTTQQWRH